MTGPDDPDRIEVLPVLPSLDLDETLAFYGAGLGFSETVFRDETYLILRRAPGLELHFWRTDDRRLCEATSVYLRGGGVVALHREFGARGIARPTPITVRPWGMEEFYVHDPHGNLLRFGRIPPG